MALRDQVITTDYALYHGDCMAVLETLPAESIHLILYSPPFGGLYQYSSDAEDLMRRSARLSTTRASNG